MKTVNVKIKGITPLLMNRPDMLELSDNIKQKLAGVDKMEEQFLTKQYVTDEGKLFTPETHLKGAIIEAGKNIKVRGKGKSTYSKIFGYSIMVSPAQIIHLKQKVEKFIAIAVNPSTKGRNPLCRPMLKDWELEFQVEYDNDEIPEEVVKEALELAGKKVGIGDWRPSKKGIYGRFIVTKFQQAD